MPVGILKIIRMLKVSFQLITIKFPALLFVASFFRWIYFSDERERKRLPIGKKEIYEWRLALTYGAVAV